MAPTPLSLESPCALQMKQPDAEAPSPCGQAAIYNHVSIQDLSARSLPDQTAQGLDYKHNGQYQLQAVKAGLGYVLGLHCPAMLGVEDGLQGPQKKRKAEKNGWDQGEVKTRRQSIVQPCLGDTAIVFTVTSQGCHSSNRGAVPFMESDVSSPCSLSGSCISAGHSLCSRDSL